MLKGGILNYIAIKVDDGKANLLNGLIIDSNWGHEGKHMTHDGVVVENDTNLPINIGGKVWFDHRMCWLGDKKFSSEDWNGTTEKGVFYYLLRESEYIQYVRVIDELPTNGYVGFKKPVRKETTDSGIYIPQTVAQPNDRGDVLISCSGLEVGDTIIHAEDNDYPSDQFEGEWFQLNGENVMFTHSDYVFAVIKGEELHPYGTWIIMEALDDDKDWVKLSGIYMPRNERVTKGLGKVIYSNTYKKDTQLIYTKRGYNSFLFNNKKYYAVKEDNVLAEL
jgi:co-chaperonin GroES (HSP10)